jgi:DNA-binding transcriptional ArsR family regulator
MRIEITKQILHELLELEVFLATLPQGENIKVFYNQQKKKTLNQNLQALSYSLELSFSEREIKNIYEGQELNINQHPVKAIRNCISALKYIDSFKEHGITFATIQHVNKILCDGYAEFWDEGKLRGPNENPNLENDGFRNRPSQFVLEDFNQIKYINANDEIEHPILKAALFLYIFIHSYPFTRFNLQTGLLCFYALVKHTKYNSRNLVPLTQVAFECFTKCSFDTPDKEEGIREFVYNLLRTYNEKLQQATGLIEQRDKIPSDILKTLNERQLKGIGILKQKRKLSRKKYALTNNIAIATAFRDLKDLVDKGLIKSEGSGRGTYYTLAEPAKSVEGTTEYSTKRIMFDDSYEEISSLDELN